MSKTRHTVKMSGNRDIWQMKNMCRDHAATIPHLNIIFGADYTHSRNNYQIQQMSEHVTEIDLAYSQA